MKTCPDLNQTNKKFEGKQAWKIPNKSFSSAWDRSVESEAWHQQQGQQLHATPWVETFWGSDGFLAQTRFAQRPRFFFKIFPLKGLFVRPEIASRNLGMFKELMFGIKNFQAKQCQTDPNQVINVLFWVDFKPKQWNQTKIQDAMMVSIFWIKASLTMSACETDTSGISDRTCNRNTKEKTRKI